MDKVTVKITVNRGGHEYEEDLALDYTQADLAEVAQEAFGDALRNLQRTMAHCELQDRVIELLTRLGYEVSDAQTQFWSDGSMTEAEEWADMVLEGAPKEETDPVPRVVQHLQTKSA